LIRSAATRFAIAYLTLGCLNIIKCSWWLCLLPNNGVYVGLQE
jgi:hypothetical protein